MSFLVFDSVIMRSLAGFATIVLNPMPVPTLSIHRQCVPVSKTSVADLSCPSRNALNPSGVVGMVVSRTILGFPDSFDMTQIFVVLSLTSAPIVVQYAVSI